MTPEYFALFARYNRWANARLYAAAAALADDAYFAPRQAFFGSIHNTLNHILVGDRIWLSRFTGTRAAIASLDQVLYADLPGLTAAREAEDARLADFVAGLDADRLAQPVDYRNMAGDAQRDRLGLLLGHLFNHQTHHRGQVHDMLSQTAVAPPPLDLLYFLRADQAGIL